MSNRDDLVAFFDESHRPVRDRKTGKPDPTKWHYVMAAAVVFVSDIERCCERLVEIETKFGYGLHYSELNSGKRRRDTVDAICGIAEWEGYVFETPKPISPGGGYEQTARELNLNRRFRT